MNNTNELKNYNDWYAYHFGSEFVSNCNFDPDHLHGKIHTNCYVMMADFCSFTSFFKATGDLCKIESLMISFYTELRKIILRHGGMLDKIMGDGVIAVWGLHNKELPSMQAIMLASQELIQLAKSIAFEWQTHLDNIIEPKGMRIGLCKGDVMVIRRNEFYPGLSILGNPLNLASRLEQAAEPNHLLCTHTVYQDLLADFKLLNDQSMDFNAMQYQLMDVKNYGTVKVCSINLNHDHVGKIFNFENILKQNSAYPHQFQA